MLPRRLLDFLSRLSYNKRFMTQESVLVTGYIHPDLDAYACAFAYAELLRALGREAQATCSGDPLDEVTFVLRLLGIDRLQDFDAYLFGSGIVVDTSDTYALPPGLNPLKVEEVVDHHLYNDPALFPHARLQIEAVGAAATLIEEKFYAAHVRPSRDAAALLYGGIISNTLNFQATVTTDRDRISAGRLRSLAELPDDFPAQLFRAKSDLSGAKLLETLRNDMAGSETAGKIFALGQLELADVHALLATRLPEMKRFMLAHREYLDAYVTMLSLSDVVAGKTYFVAADAFSEDVLERALGLTFHQGVAEYPKLILRKEYVAPLKQAALAGAMAV
jgi:inorganic pyrophosphatase/exopolyphosphatase